SPRRSPPTPRWPSATPSGRCAWAWGPTSPPVWRSRTEPGGRPPSAGTARRAWPPSPRSGRRGGRAADAAPWRILCCRYPPGPGPREEDDVSTKVLLAEDDPTISEPLARAFRREGYEVTVAEDGRAALSEGARNGVYDLLVLDLGLPRLDGLAVCRGLRDAGVGIPVLMPTARTDEIDTVVGLDAGADDYVTKPFRLGELLARVRA